MFRNLFKNKKGFTLMEFIVIILVMAVLSTVVYIAVSPAKRISNTQNSIRVQDTQNIEKAIKAFLLDSTTSSTTISDLSEDTYYSLVVSGGSTSGDYTCVELESDISNKIDIASSIGSYLDGDIPVDPDISSGDDTGYYLVRTGNLFNVGHCNWDYINCGDGVCADGETTTNCAADCASDNSPPVEPDPSGRNPANGGSAYSMLRWWSWFDPDEDIVEYQINIYTDENCLFIQQSSSWSSQIRFIYSTLGMINGHTYYWQTRARSQGYSDETDYNTCYSFINSEIEL